MWTQGIFPSLPVSRLRVFIALMVQYSLTLSPNYSTFFTRALALGTQKYNIDTPIEGIRTFDFRSGGLAGYYEYLLHRGKL